MALTYQQNDGSKIGIVSLMIDKAVMSSLSLNEEVFWSDNLDYLGFNLLEDDTYIVYAKSNSTLPKMVVIPSVFNGKPVTKIAGSAFLANSTAKNVVSVAIGANIKDIVNEAFNACDNLETVSFSPNIKLQHIGTSAFACANLKTILLPKGIGRIDNYAFSDSGISIYCEDSVPNPDWAMYWNGENPVYYYSETEPVTEGNYWHYVDGAIVEWADEGCRNGHTYIEVVTEPTCQEEGYTTHTCSECGHSYVDNYTEKVSHSYVFNEKVEPTCTEHGFTRYLCKWCNAINIVNTTMPLGHDYGDWVVTKEATATETGSKYRECKRCGHTETAIIDKDLSYTETEDGNLSVGGSTTARPSEVIIPSQVNGHNVNAVSGKAFFSSPIVAVHFSPVIERIGASAFENCKMLNGTYLPSNITDIEPLAFAGCENAIIYCEAESKPEGWADDWVDDSVTVVWGHTHTNRIISVLPTCTDKGYNLATCEVCGYKQQSNITPALGHSWKDATCTKPKTCNVCGETEGEALGHTWVDATCTTPKTCSVCGTTEGEALGHTEVSIPPVPPTCTEAGLTEGKKCSVCGEITFAPIPFPATGHTWSDWEETIAPSCTTEGEEKRTCTRCGATETQSIAATEHSYSVSNETDSTCTERGYIEYTCDECLNDSYKEYKELDPDAHDYGDWTTDTDPTCATVGTRHRTCARCGNVETEEIPIDTTNHNWSDWEITTPATCEVDGQEERKCTRCGETESRSYPSTGHNWSDWTIDIEPTCTDKGSKSCTCMNSNCGAFKSEDISALGHDYVIRPVEPTCTEQGYTSNTCSRCGDTFNGAYVDALGHTPSDWIIDKQPTVEAEGSKHKECTVCGTVLETATIDNSIYLVTESGEFLTDEQGNLLIL